MLIYNAIRTPDGTVLESTFRHDYVTYTDANGKEYMVDGGHDYCRRSAHGDEVDLSLTYEDSTHEQRREFLKWGTRGVDGKQPLRRIAIAEMDADHIEACLDTQPQMSSAFRCTMEQELRFRATE